ncbi:MAG: class I adenylate-forming enzyme family protein [Alsobacter sp.]
MIAEPYIDAVVGTLAARRDEVVLISRDAPWRADDFLHCIHRYARALRSDGLGAGTLVALWAPNTAQALAIRYAANLIGAATCFLSTPATAEARAELLQQMAPDLVVIFPETVHLLPSSLTAAVMSVGETGRDFPRLDDLAAAASPRAVASTARPHDLAVIISSGGSTGVPKGSCRDFAAYASLALSHSNPGRRQLVNGKLAYLSQVLVDQTLTGGGVVVLRDHFDPADTLSQIERHRITDLFLVEPQLFALMDHSGLEGAKPESLQRLLHIGASAPATLRRRAFERFGPVLVHTYGASEAGLVSRLGPDGYAADSDALCSAGQVLPGVEVRLRRADGAIAGAGGTGAIEVRSSATASGYRNAPERTAAAFADGWYLSGDLGTFDAAGRLHVLGRAKDIVQEGEKVISPTLIEELLCHERSVRCASVVRDVSERRWVALVQPAKGVVDFAPCRSAIASTLGNAVADETMLIERAAVPLTEQGKPDRAAILCLASGS